MSTDPDWVGQTDLPCEHLAEKQQKCSGSIIYFGEERESKLHFSSKTPSLMSPVIDVAGLPRGWPLPEEPQKDWVECSQGTSLSLTV